MAWALYDFANSGYTTVVLTTVFSAYFVAQVAQGAPWATFALTCALSASYALAMVVLPPLGAWADQHAGKRHVLRVSTLACVALTTLLATIGPGDIFAGLVVLALSNLAYCIGETVIAAFLPDLARPQAFGRVSGWGWGVGYLGGMLTLGLGLGWVAYATALGWHPPQFVPGVMLITACIFLAAALPALFFLPEKNHPSRRPNGVGSSATYSAGGSVQPAVRSAPSVVACTLRSVLVQFPDFRWLLLCGAFYHAGISVVITLSAVYATQAMGFDMTQTMLLVFVVNITAAVGALVFGHVQDTFGHTRALGGTLVGWVLMIVLAVMATGPAMFWMAAALAGLCMGTSQSAGRAMVAALAPNGHAARFYALWSWAVRLAAIVGPLTYGAVTWLTEGNHRLALLVTGVFFLAALLTLRCVDFARGVRVRDTNEIGA